MNIAETLWKNPMTGRFFLRSAKALVMVTLSDSFKFRRRFRFFAVATLKSRISDPVEESDLSLLLV